MLKTALFASCLLLLSWCGFVGTAHAEDGIAVAVVYDLSGSMKDSVPDASGKKAPKYIIAKRALLSVVDRIQQFADSAKDKKLAVSLLVFGNDRVQQALPLADFKAQTFRDWAASAPDPNGGTPIGEALKVATAQLLASPLDHKHILIITDGENTVGAKPEKVLPDLRKQAEAKETFVGVHIVAFDVSAKVFEPLKKLDCTVVGAANEQQLNTQLNYVLQEKMLVE